MLVQQNRITQITGSWSDEANAWVSDIVEVKCDSWLEVTLPSKGRLVIKKAETVEGPWPKAMITGWVGPEIRTRIYGSTDGALLKFCLTETPKSIKLISTGRLGG